jgi:hypothetical protein
VSAAWASIIVALISGPIMWVLYRLDKRNTQQHGQAVDLIKEVRQDVSNIKLIQSLTNFKIDRQVEVLEKHLEEHGNADNADLL